MNNIIITLISNKKNIDNMILEVDSYNVLLMYIDQLKDQEVAKRYDAIIINSRELVYNLCKEKLENSYNNISLEKSVVDDFVESIFNAINNLEYKIIYQDVLIEALFFFLINLKNVKINIINFDEVELDVRRRTKVKMCFIC